MVLCLSFVEEEGHLLQLLLHLPALFPFVPKSSMVLTTLFHFVVLFQTLTLVLSLLFALRGWGMILEKDLFDR